MGKRGLSKCWLRGWGGGKWQETEEWDCSGGGLPGQEGGGQGGRCVAIKGGRGGGDGTDAHNPDRAGAEETLLTNDVTRT